jgi:hypothetical protein
MAKDGIVNSEGVVISCNEPGINDFTCLSSSDLESLKVQIEKAKKYCKGAK